MVQDTRSLPAGAGSTTGTASRAGESRSRSSAASFSTGDDASSRVQETGFASGPGDLVVYEDRSGPSTATIVGAAIAGAVVGGAIPFMLRGRSSSSGAPSQGQQEAVVNESVIVRRPARELYDFWRNFTNLPEFMDNIKSVDRLDELRSHWVVKAPAGTSVEFDSRVTDDVPGRAIAWASEEGASVPNRGRVEFVETSSGNATNVRVTMSYDPPAGTAGRLVAKLFQREPSVQAREDLERFKALMEARR
jgi:uncharacterized membrane protein